MSPPRRGDSSCGDVRALLSPSLDGALDAVDHRRVEEHVARCALCAEELAELRAPGERIAAAFSRVKSRPDFLHRVLDRVERGLPTLSRVADAKLTRTLERACAAAALVLVALLLAVTRVGRAAAVGPGLERILGTSVDVAAGSIADGARPHTESELLAVILADPNASDLIEEIDR